jgi:phage recombination protein Bet
MSEEPALIFTDAERTLLREKNKKLSDVEFGAFMAACQRYQLNPLANQIYARLTLETQKNPRSVVYMTQIDGYRLIADRTGAYAGSDDIAYAVDGDGENAERKATCTVHKIVGGEPRPFAASAWWSEFYPGGNQAFMWDKMPHLMLGKCAEALALRKAFPAQLAGLYTDTEMQQADAGAPASSETNPFREEQQKRAAERRPSSNPPASKPVANPIADCKTQKALIQLLDRWEKDAPIGTKPKRWEEIANAADERFTELGGATEEAIRCMDAIWAQIETAKQGAEAFSGGSAQ